MYITFIKNIHTYLRIVNCIVCEYKSLININQWHQQHDIIWIVITFQVQDEHRQKNHLITLNKIHFNSKLSCVKFYVLNLLNI